MGKFFFPLFKMTRKCGCTVKCQCCEKKKEVKELIKVICKSLVPGVNCALNLGTKTHQWLNVYVCGTVYTNNVSTLSGDLNLSPVGNINANSLINANAGIDFPTKVTLEGGVPSVLDYYEVVGPIPVVWTVTYDPGSFTISSNVDYLRIGKDVTLRLGEILGSPLPPSVLALPITLTTTIPSTYSRFFPDKAQDFTILAKDLINVISSSATLPSDAVFKLTVHHSGLLVISSSPSDFLTVLPIDVTNVIDIARTSVTYLKSVV